MWSVALIGLVGAAISLVVGNPSLRLRGISLTIVTLAFGAACEQYFFTREGDSRDRLRSRCHAKTAARTGHDQAIRGLYYAVLIVLGIALVLA